MYKTIELLKPYFFSLREINGNLSLDLKFPVKWTYNVVLSRYKNIRTKEQDKNNENSLLSIISESSEIGCNAICACAMEIIKYNKEIEEKEKLYQEKIDELQKLFINKSLDELKNLNFIQENEDRDREGIRTIGKGKGKISEGDINSQEQDDTTIKIN